MSNRGGFIETHTIDLEGRRIQFQSVGSAGPTLVLLHGWPQTGLCWRGVAPLLADDHRVVIPDLRGYGGSVADPALSFDKRSVASDLTELVARLDCGPVTVVGHDRGARVAHRWALDRPDDVERLALLDVLPTREASRGIHAGNAHAVWHWLFHAVPDLPERLLTGNLRAYLEHFLARPRAAGHIDDDTFEAYVAAYEGPASMHGWLGDYRAAFGADLEHDDADFDAGRRLRQPLLLLWGGAGGLATTDVVDRWDDYADAAGGKALPGCGHYVPEERPAEVAEEVRRFVAARKWPLQ